MLSLIVHVHGSKPLIPLLSYLVCVCLFTYCDRRKHDEAVPNHCLVAMITNSICRFETKVMNYC